MYGKENEKKADVSQANGKENDNPIVNILKEKKNIILQGAPGTGKTYMTATLALSVIGELPPQGSETEKEYHEKVMREYEKLLIKFDDKGNIVGEGQIGFVTFHQSMDYEDFVEGIKPQIELICDKSEDVKYKCQDGLFKNLCKVAKKTFDAIWDEFIANIGANKLKLKTARGKAFKVDVNKNGNLNLSTREKGKNGSLTKEKIIDFINGKTSNRSSYYSSIANELKKKNELKKNYVLIIDEINRGNVSKIFGELISLLEADKRAGGDHPLTVTLPYSKEQFSVPSNLYIIGTMNTTDRSVGSIDYAVRRRFAFVTLPADENLVPKGDARNLFNAVKNFLDKSKYDMEIDDLMVGHSYFMDADNLQMKWQYEILPLLMEYHKDGIISKSPLKDAADKDIADVKKNYANFTAAWKKPDSDTSKS